MKPECRLFVYYSTRREKWVVAQESASLPSVAPVVFSSFSETEAKAWAEAEAKGRADGKAVVQLQDA